MQFAWAQAADAVECDVHLTRDGRLAVIHDADLRRVAGSALRVADATLADVQRFDAGSWKSATYTGERIPELSRVLRTVPPARRAFVELKGGPELVPELARCVAQAGFDASRLVVISFALAAVQAAKRALPGAEACWILEQTEPPGGISFEQIARTARAAGLDGVDLQYDWPVDAAAVERAHSAGLKLYVWTVDEAAAASRLAAAGVDGITTNRPGWLRGELQRASEVTGSSEAGSIRG